MTTSRASPPSRSASPAAGAGGEAAAGDRAARHPAREGIPRRRRQGHAAGRAGGRHPPAALLRPRLARADEARKGSSWSSASRASTAPPSPAPSRASGASPRCQTGRCFRRQRGRRSRPDTRRHRLPLGGRYRTRLPRPGAGRAWQRGAPGLRLANLLFLGHNLSVDKYVEDILQHARLVIVRLLGGARYWPYGIEQVSDCCRRRGIVLAVLPGDDQPDPELTALSTLEPPAAHRLRQYCVQGGPANARNLRLYAASLLGRVHGVARARRSAARRALLAGSGAADAR